MEALKGRPPDTEPRSFGRAVVKQVGAELPSPPTSLRSPRTSAEQVGITWDLASDLSRPRPEQVGAELRSRKLAHLRLTMKAADLGLAMVKYEKAQARSPHDLTGLPGGCTEFADYHSPRPGQANSHAAAGALVCLKRLQTSAVELPTLKVISPNLRGSPPSRLHLVVSSPSPCLHLVPSRSISSPPPRRWCRPTRRHRRAARAARSHPRCAASGVDMPYATATECA